VIVRPALLPARIPRHRRATAALVVAGLAVLAALGSCSGHDDPSSSTATTTATAGAPGRSGRSVTTPDGQVSLTLDGRLPTGWPSGIPIPPGSTPAGSGVLQGSSADVSIGVLTTTSTPRQVLAFYSGAGRASGPASAVGSGRSFVGTVGLATPPGRVTVVPGGDGSYVIVTLPARGTGGTSTTAGTASTSSTVPSGSSVPSTTARPGPSGGEA
jgi:hypothetical protein